MEASDFEILFERHFDQVVRVLSFYSTDRNEIEDWAHDVFIKVWESRHRIDVNHPHVRAYILTTARNYALQTIQARRIIFKRSDEAEPKQGWNNVDQYIDYTALQKDYQSALDLIPEKPRRVFLLSRENGLTYAEIARDLGITTKTVEAHITTAMRILRERLKLYL